MCVCVCVCVSVTMCVSVCMLGEGGGGGGRVVITFVCDTSYRQRSEGQSPLPPLDCPTSTDHNFVFCLCLELLDPLVLLL